MILNRNGSSWLQLIVALWSPAAGRHTKQVREQGGTIRAISKSSPKIESIRNGACHEASVDWVFDWIGLFEVVESIVTFACSGAREIMSPYNLDSMCSFHQRRTSLVELNERKTLILILPLILVFLSLNLVFVFVSYCAHLSDKLSPRTKA